MVRSFHVVVVAGFALLGLPASAQSMNVDFGPPGSPLGTPSRRIQGCRRVEKVSTLSVRIFEVVITASRAARRSALA